MEDVYAYLLIIMSLLYGFLMQKFWFDPLGKASLMNMLGRNYGVVRFVDKSRRTKFIAADFNKVEWTYLNNTYELKNAKRTYLGNLAMVNIHEGNTVPVDDLEVEEHELNAPIKLTVSCPQCKTDFPVEGSFPIKVPVRIEQSAGLMTAYLNELWAQIRAQLFSRNQLMLMMAAASSILIIAAWFWISNVSTPNTTLDCVAAIKANAQMLNQSIQTAVCNRRVL